MEIKPPSVCRSLCRLRSAPVQRTLIKNCKKNQNGKVVRLPVQLKSNLYTEIWNVTTYTSIYLVCGSTGMPWCVRLISQLVEVKTGLPYYHFQCALGPWRPSVIREINQTTVLQLISKMNEILNLVYGLVNPAWKPFYLWQLSTETWWYNTVLVT